MATPGTKYVIVTPVRNEEANLRRTIQSVLDQSVLPQEWAIVNDGSTDKTADIVEEFAGRYSWIRPVHRVDRGCRKPGGGVVEAFNDGYRALASGDWDFIVKLDGDLSFEPRYFEQCFECFERDARLGIAGGSIYHIEHGRECIEDCPDFHVRGATKIYRRACWDAIGGLWPAPGWDTMDEVKAQMLGWNTRSLRDLHVIHHRYTGAADGAWANWVKNGRANYICGYHPLFMLGKCVRRLVVRPFVVGSFALMYGFVTGYWGRIPQVDDAKAIAFLRRQQLGRLFGGQTIWR